jgi:hypothetical protein
MKTFNCSENEEPSILKINEFEEFVVNSNTSKEESHVKYLVKVLYVGGIEKTREFDHLKSIEDFFGFELFNITSIEFITKDGKSHYWASKNFNLKYLWNTFVWGEKTIIKESTKRTKKYVNFHWDRILVPYKIYNIRENILYEMHTKLMEEHCVFEMKYHDYSYKSLKGLIENYGKTNENIFKEITSLSGMSKCTKCGEIKTVSEFYKSKKEESTSWCKSCFCKKTKKDYYNNREYYLEKSKTYHSNNKKNNKGYDKKCRKPEEKKLHQENYQKKCTQCGEVKSESEFYKNKNGGFHSWCKSCYSKKSTGYRAKKKEHIKEHSRKYYLENKELIGENNKKYHELHYDKMKSYYKNYQKEYNLTDVKKLSVLKLRLKVALKQETKDKLQSEIDLLTQKINSKK